MIKSNSKKAIENIKKYIVDNTTKDTDCVSDSYISSVQMLKTGMNPETGRKVDKFSVAAWVIYGSFKEQYKYQMDLYKTEQNAFVSWLSGLPSVIDSCYFYNRSAVDDLGAILEETEKEKEKYTESDAEQLLSRLIYREIKKQIYRIKF